jgi:hypothetical protein
VKHQVLMGWEPICTAAKIRTPGNIACAFASQNPTRSRRSLDRSRRYSERFTRMVTSES